MRRTENMNSESPAILLNRRSGSPEFRSFHLTPTTIQEDFSPEGKTNSTVCPWFMHPGRKRPIDSPSKGHSTLLTCARLPFSHLKRTCLSPTCMKTRKDAIAKFAQSQYLTTWRQTTFRYVHNMICCKCVFSGHQTYDQRQMTHTQQTKHVK